MRREHFSAQSMMLFSRFDAAHASERRWIFFAVLFDFSLRSYHAEYVDYADKLHTPS